MVFNRLLGRLLVVAVLCFAALLPAKAQWLLVYSNDFEGPVGSEWSKNITSVTPIGARGFLGAFGEESVRLTLTNLPLHPAIVVEFELFVIGSWDGVDYKPEGPSPLDSPDLWQLSEIGGPILLNTTFSNTHHFQSYPGNYPAVYPARTGAVENNTLGFSEDSVYRLTFTFTHTAPTLRLLFSGMPTSPDERWGIDNIKVYAVPEPSTMATLLVGGAFLALRSRRRR